MILYVAGPMSGYPNFNYDLFDRVERELATLGYTVLNPTTNSFEEEKDRTWDNYMRASIAQVIQANGIAILPGWQNSAGATLEVRIAHALRIPVLPVGVWMERGGA